MWRDNTSRYFIFSSLGKFEWPHKGPFPLFIRQLGQFIAQIFIVQSTLFQPRSLRAISLASYLNFVYATARFLRVRLFESL